MMRRERLDLGAQSIQDVKAGQNFGARLLVFLLFAQSLPHRTSPLVLMP